MDEGPKRRPTRNLPAIPADSQPSSEARPPPEHTEVVKIEPEAPGPPSSGKSMRRLTKDVPVSKEKATEALLDDFFDELGGAEKKKPDRVPTSPNAVLPWSGPSAKSSDTQENLIPADELIVGPASPPAPGRRGAEDDLLVGSVPDPFDDDDFPPVGGNTGKRRVIAAEKKTLTGEPFESMGSPHQETTTPHGHVHESMRESRQENTAPHVQMPELMREARQENTSPHAEPFESMREGRRENTRPDGTMVSPMPEPPDETTIPLGSPLAPSGAASAMREAVAAADSTRVEPIPDPPASRSAAPIPIDPDTTVAAPQPPPSGRTSGRTPAPPELAPSGTQGSPSSRSSTRMPRPSTREMKAATAIPEARSNKTSTKMPAASPAPEPRPIPRPEEAGPSRSGTKIPAVDPATAPESKAPIPATTLSPVPEAIAAQRASAKQSGPPLRIAVQETSLLPVPESEGPPRLTASRPVKAPSERIAVQETKLFEVPESERNEQPTPPPVAVEPTNLFKYPRGGGNAAPVPVRKLSDEIPAIKAKLAEADAGPKKKGGAYKIAETFTGMIQIGPMTHLQRLWLDWPLRTRIVAGASATVIAVGLFALAATLLVAAFTDRPNSDELLAAYPYGYAGQKATRGVDAPPAVNMTYTLEGQRPCGGTSTDMCLQYRYEGTNGFRGYMLLHKAGTQWERFGLEGSPFDIDKH